MHMSYNYTDQEPWTAHRETGYGFTEAQSAI
jgi:hypothetical protein